MSTVSEWKSTLSEPEGHRYNKEILCPRTAMGWTLSGPSMGPFFIEDLEMYPDPVGPRQEVRFKVKLRNDGRIVRA